jgi:hypothetical protein
MDKKTFASYAWQPIETAPHNGEQRIIIAEIRNDELVDIDFDAQFVEERESWEMPQPYWIWQSAFGRLENPTHWTPMPELSNGKGTHQCEWWDEDGVWNSSCGVAFEFTDGSPDENGFGFCFKCGKPILNCGKPIAVLLPKERV